MKIHFLGATKTVTGSKHLVIGEKHNILIDCGLYQGEDADKFNKDILNKIEGIQIDAIILTHAHLDHCGHLPKIVSDRQGKVKIFSTHPTRDLAYIIMSDNAKILAQENKNRSNKDSSSPLYQQIHVDQTMPLFECGHFEETLKFKEFDITFFRAGHILGASTVVISDGKQKIQFSGDLGRIDDLIMLPPQTMSDVDQLVLESTYGNRNHPSDDPIEALSKVIYEHKRSGGTLLIPSFAVGRAQAILFALHKVFELRPELKLPVYADSPMMHKVYELYYKYPKFHKISETDLRKIQNDFRFIHYRKERAKTEGEQTQIIVSASGMLTGGTVREHLKQHIQDANSTILIVGYQAPGTLGRLLLETPNKIILEQGKELELKAKVKELKHFSSHADMNQLLHWINPAKLKQIFLIHGEESAKQNLLQSIIGRLQIDAIAPSSDSAYSLEMPK